MSTTLEFTLDHVNRILPKTSTLLSTFWILGIWISQAGASLVADVGIDSNLLTVDGKVFFAQAGRNGIHLRLGLLEGNSCFEPAKDSEVGLVPGSIVRVLQRGP